MSRQNFLESSNEFSIYGVVRFTTYILSAMSLYMENFQVASSCNSIWIWSYTWFSSQNSKNLGVTNG